MTKLLNITFNDLRVIFRDRGIWLNLVAIPIALVFFIGLANGGLASDTQFITMDVLDYDNTALSAQFIAELRRIGTTLQLCPLDAGCNLADAPYDETIARQRLIDRATLGLVVIPAGFEASVQSGTAAQVIFRSDDDATAPGFLQRSVQAVVQRYNGALVARRVGEELAARLLIPDTTAFGQTVYDGAAAALAQDPIRVAVSTSTAQDVLTRRQTGFGQSTAGMGTMYVMFTVMAGISALLEERRQWTLQRLVMMPVRRWQLLGGKMLARFLMGILQYAVAFATGAALGVSFGSDPLALGLLMVSFALCITALTFFLATLMQTPEQASGITLFIILTLGPLGGAWWPLEIVPDWMRTVAHVSPVAWVMDGFHALMFFDGTLSGVLLPLLVLFGAAAALFGAAVLRFRYE